MKKIILPAILIAFLSSFCFAQNLVPNCSFEDTVACPNIGGQIFDAVGWSSYGASPDYYNPCSPTGLFSVPSNSYGYQNAATGKAYCGIVPWVKGGNDTLYAGTREFIGRALSSPLVIGQKYYVAFKANFTMPDSINNSEIGYATNKLGARFSTVPYNGSNPEPINNIAHVYSDSIITDSISWTTISGWFVADSTYGYIAIGNFFKNDNTDSVIINSTWYASYYYIDDICVSLDSTKCSCDSTNGIDTYNQDNSVFVFPNPAKDKIYLQLVSNDKISIKIYDCLGILQLSEMLLPNKKEVQLDKLLSGIYILQIEYSNSIGVKKIIIQK